MNAFSSTLARRLAVTTLAASVSLGFGSGVASAESRERGRSESVRRDTGGHPPVGPRCSDWTNEDGTWGTDCPPDPPGPHDGRCPQLKLGICPWTLVNNTP